MLYDPIPMKVKNREIYRDIKHISGCLGLGMGWGGKRLKLKAMRFLLKVIKMFWD